MAGDSSPEDRPQQLPFQEGKMKVTALAAPAKAGTMLTPPAKVKVCVTSTRCSARCQCLPISPALMAAMYEQLMAEMPLDCMASNWQHAFEAKPPSMAK